MIRSFLLRLAAASLVVAAGSRPAAAGVDDQTQADTVVEEFGERMTAEGWTFAGPGDEAAPPDPNGADAAIASCVKGYANLLSSSEDPLPGETARAYSDLFAFTPEPEAPVTTAPYEFGHAQIAAAFVLSVDEADTIGALVDALGSPDLPGCIDEEFTAAQASTVPSTPESAPPWTEQHLETQTLPGLEAGERSAGLMFAVTGIDAFDKPFEIDVSLAVAQVGRTLVAVTLISFTPDPTSGFDVNDELGNLAQVVENLP